MRKTGQKHDEKRKQIEEEKKRAEILPLCAKEEKVEEERKKRECERDG